ncbi:hypothetical protein, partial [Nonomuraea rhizosphaerae]|uniref:hypothetical protein n=1 Tax=Nonomuraea rhizosphaerae TaxID=2665663 RepID=UPI0027E3ACAA
MAGLDEGAVEGQAGGVQGVAVALEAFAARVQGGGEVADEADPAVAVRDQVGDALLGAGAVAAEFLPPPTDRNHLRAP